MAWLSHAMTLPVCIMHKVFDIQSANFLCLPCLTPFTSWRANGRSVQTQIPAADTVCLRLANFCVSPKPLQMLVHSLSIKWFSWGFVSTTCPSSALEIALSHPGERGWGIGTPQLSDDDRKNSGSFVRIPCRMWRWVRDGWRWVRDGWGWVVSGMVCRCSRSLVPTVLRYTWKTLSCQTGQPCHVTWPEKNRTTVHSCIVFQIGAFHLVKGMAARPPGTSHKLAMVKLLRLGSGSPWQACLVPVGGHLGARWRHCNYRTMTWFYCNFLVITMIIVRPEEWSWVDHE